MRLFSSLRLMVAPSAYEPGQHTSVTFVSRLDQLTPGRPPLLAVRLPEVTGLASYLSGRISLTIQRCRLWHRRHFGKFSRTLPWFRVFPGAGARFVRLSPVFSSQALIIVVLSWPLAPCWCAVATVDPQGHCDSRRLETGLHYLTRLGSVSNRS